MIGKLTFFLNSKQKLGVIFLTVLILIGALLETLGVSAIIPIVQMMMSPQSAQNNKYILKLADVLAVDSVEQTFMALLATMIFIYVIKNIYLLFLSYVQAKFVNANQAKTQGELLEWYLNRPYEYFLHSDVAVILRTIRSDIQNVFLMLMTLMQLLTEILVSACICIWLFTTDWSMTFFLLCLLGGVTLFITKILKRRIGNLGRKNQDFIAVLTKWILQSMNGIKIVKVMQKEEYFDMHHKEDLVKQAKINTRYSVFNNMPKLLLETVCISGILLYLMICIKNGQDIARMASVISAFAIAAFRVLPSVSRISTHLANLSYYEPSLNTIYNMVKNEGYEGIFQQGRTEKVNLNKGMSLTINKTIELKNITFSYPGTEKLILNNANMNIPVGKSIGIKGPSGAGKTTVVDILLGLLKIQHGNILCDGISIHEHKEEWLSQIGYIPQNIYLTDDSIKSNIAFGVEKREIDINRVWEVLEEAQMKQFVEELPNGLDTTIGEQGVRISGGQKQRLGIARALYYNPEILIFDEATSALDNETEAAIMEAIERFKGKKTLIIIAHRLKTIEECDLVYEVRDGKILLL